MLGAHKVVKETISTENNARHPLPQYKIRNNKGGLAAQPTDRHMKPLSRFCKEVQFKSDVASKRQQNPQIARQNMSPPTCQTMHDVNIKQTCETLKMLVCVPQCCLNALMVA